MADLSASSKELPPQARRRIEALEASVHQLTGALWAVVAELEPSSHAGGRRPLTGLLKRLDIPSIKIVGKPDRARVRTPSLGRPGNLRDTSAPPEFLAAGKSGETGRLRWVSAGEVVPAKALAEAWGLTPQALGPAAKRGDLFAVAIKSLRYYPKEFLTLDREVVAAVCKQLEPLTPSEKLFFWKQKHGALGGRTVSEVLHDRKSGSPAAQVARVAQFANARAAQARAAAQA